MRDLKALAFADHDPSDVRLTQNGRELENTTPITELSKFNKFFASFDCQSSDLQDSPILDATVANV